MSGNDQGEKDFAEFEAAGEVEVGEANLASQEEAEPKKAVPRRGPPKEKAAAKEAAPTKDDNKPGADEEDEDGEDAGVNDQDGDEESDEDTDDKDKKPEKKERKPSDRIRELSKRLRDSERLRVADAERLARIERTLENGGLPSSQNGHKSGFEEIPAPDPTDTDKYPLGHLDDRYIEDKLEWLSEKKAAERADAVLQRQQETEQSRRLQQEQTELLGKVDDLATRGSEQFDDFQESVVEAGMRGDWDLSQATFEAAHEAENGAQILYELSQDKKEAARVAKLSSYQQLKFVQERDAEIGQGKKVRRIPQAGEPPRNTARGANSRTQINPATDNLDDFEKAWEADAKRGNR